MENKSINKKIGAKEYRNVQYRLLQIAQKNPGCRLLDIGCNDGEFTSEFAKRISAEEIFGVDVYEPAIKKAKNRGINVFKVDLNKGRLPFQSNFFDVILCNQVAEHLIDQDNLFSEIARVLKPKGFLYISVPNLCAFHNRIFVLLGWQPTAIWTSYHVIFGNPILGRQRLSGIIHYKHLTAFSPLALKEMLEFYGLKVIKLTGSGFYPFLGKISSILSRMFPNLAVYLVAICIKEKNR